MCAWSIQHRCTAVREKKREKGGRGCAVISTTLTLTERYFTPRRHFMGGAGQMLATHSLMYVYFSSICTLASKSRGER